MGDADDLIHPGDVATYSVEGLQCGVEVALIAQAPLNLLRELAWKDQTVGVNVAEHQVARAPDRLAPVRPTPKEERPCVRLGIDRRLNRGERIGRGYVVVLRKPHPGCRCLLRTIRPLRLADAMQAGVVLEPALARLLDL